MVRVIERAERDLLGEGLMWSARERSVYWTDIIGCKLHRLELASGRIGSWDMPEMIGWVVERRQGGLIAGLHHSIAEVALEPFRIEPIVRPEPDLPDNRRNDAKADRFGRIWAGSMDIGCEKDAGSLFRLDPDRSLHRIDGPYIIANGPAFSADGHWLYHTDTGRGTIYRFPFGEAGVLGPREPYIVFEPGWGRPDGMTVDAENGLWVAHWDGARVTRFVDGKPERAIALPTPQITNCLFAGPELDRMFVTSAAEGRPEDPHAGCLFEVDPGVKGLPTQMFAG
jgi:xylono-1,5-lactonase